MKTIENTKPDLVGTMGQAWLPDLEAIGRKYPDGPPADLTVGCWYVRAPWSHPMWSNYMIVCLALREVEGMPPLHVYLKGATHEIDVVALDPDHQVDLEDRARMLTPINFMGQFIAESDEAARLRVEASVKEVINGILSPDTDFMSMWVSRYGDHGVRK